MPDLRGFLSFRRFIVEGGLAHQMPANLVSMDRDKLAGQVAGQAYMRGGQTDPSFKWGRAAQAAGTAFVKDKMDDLAGGMLGDTAASALKAGAETAEGGVEAGVGHRVAGVARGLANAGLSLAADKAGMGTALAAGRAAYAGYQAGKEPDWMHAKRAAEDSAAKHGAEVHAFQLDDASDRQIIDALGPEKLALFYKMLAMDKYVGQATATHGQVPDDYAIRFARSFMQKHGKSFLGGPQMQAPLSDQRPAERLLPRNAAARPGYRPSPVNQPLPAQRDPAEINWLG